MVQIHQQSIIKIKAQFIKSLLVDSESEEVESEDVTNPLAGVESRAGAYI